MPESGSHMREGHGAALAASHNVSGSISALRNEGEEGLADAESGGGKGNIPFPLISLNHMWHES